jgi:23S rRNA pseudouridine955/2504/2580 synthase
MPIVGDDKYGDFDKNKALARTMGPAALKRMFLHAARLQCKHPANGEALNFHAQLPSELVHFLTAVLPAAVSQPGSDSDSSTTPD